MADKNKKGTVSSYNEIPVTVRDYYYDRNETDKTLRKHIGDMFVNLEIANYKLKKELDKEKKTEVKLELPKKK